MVQWNDHNELKPPPRPAPDIRDSAPPTTPGETAGFILGIAIVFVSLATVIGLVAMVAQYSIPSAMAVLGVIVVAVVWGLSGYKRG